ncbi:hypothetical protein BCR44DRAFT_1423717 [Catenaria anguillulae PL171]|uniref:Uncharacterized protein n=1 Tax=Catenaria anguillulae PL171 TaxID=765915 RepID=A0A1Y2I1L9_9FUNG|nr:hypothetical protein BCR44DRAFT_1423717 [Catenaria anguillulae PL171]
MPTTGSWTATAGQSLGLLVLRGWVWARAERRGGGMMMGTTVIGHGIMPMSIGRVWVRVRVRVRVIVLADSPGNPG